MGAGLEPQPRGSNLPPKTPIPLLLPPPPTPPHTSHTSPTAPGEFLWLYTVNVDRGGQTWLGPTRKKNSLIMAIFAPLAPRERVLPPALDMGMGMCHEQAVKVP